jgi:hypothetical protein
MGPKMRRNFSGAFVAHDRGDGTWQLTRAAPHEMAVILRDAERRAAHAFGAAPLLDLGIEWYPEKVLLTFISGNRVATVEATIAIVHEPLRHLYESFWRRVFRLVRIPGGRYLLKVLTRPGKR